MKARFAGRWLGMCVGTCALLAAAPGFGRSLIEQAYEAGQLDLATALQYQIQQARDPQTLPAAYRQSPSHPICGTPLVVRALAVSRSTSADARRRLAKVLARPRTRYDVLSKSGHFRIHYDLQGDGAVDPADRDGNGIPDYVDEVMGTVDHVWSVELDSMGFRPPPSDQGLGGGPEYDVYLTELGRGGSYGFTYPETGGNTTYSYLQLDNNYTDPIYRQTSGIDALHVTVAHEFNHAIQFGYYQGSDGIWWQEATAVWMEDRVYPQVDDYLQYLPGFLEAPEKSLDSGSRYATDYHIYGATLFTHFLAEHYAPDAVRQTWEAFGHAGNADISHFDWVIHQYDSGGMGSAMAEFSVWNYFTGPRWRRGYYAEGGKYPAVRMHDMALDLAASKATAERSDYVDHLGSTYLRLEPRFSPGGVELEVRRQGAGRWRNHLVLASADSVRVLPLEPGVQSVPGWDRYQEVVLILSEIDEVGVAYQYAAAITYDSDLLDAPPPVALTLGPPYPNPFRPVRDHVVYWPYTLDVPSRHTGLSIFDASGGLVRRIDLGSRPSRALEVSWDGCNQAGRTVAGGIYYGVLEADGRRVHARIAVLRGDDD